jgi:hypothetical protein
VVTEGIVKVADGMQVQLAGARAPAPAQGGAP